MIKKLVIFCLFQAVALSFYSYAFGAENFALDDLKNIYIEKTFKKTSPDIVFDSQIYDSGLKGFKKSLESIGFKIVDNIVDADAKVVFYVKGFMVDKKFGDWSFHGVEADFFTKDDFFISMFEAKSQTGGGDSINQWVKKLSAQIKSDFDSHEKKYIKVPADELKKMEGVVNAPAEYSSDIVFQKKKGLQLVRNKDYLNVGIIFIPVWYSSELEDAPSLKDTLVDVKKINDDSDAKMYVVTSMPDSEVKKNGLSKFYPDDIRNMLFFGFSSLAEKYRINLYEILYEDYLKDILAGDLKGVLTRIKQDKPDLKRIFVIYYNPKSEWVDTTESYPYKLKTAKHGLQVFVLIGYFSLEGEPERLTDEIISFNDAKLEKVSVSYSSIIERMRTVGLPMILEKKLGRLKVDDFSKKNIDDKKIFILNKDTYLYSENGSKIIRLVPKAEVEVLSENTDSYNVTIRGYVASKDAEPNSKGELVIKGNKAQVSRIPLIKNQFAYGKTHEDDLIGVLENQAVLPSDAILSTFDGKEKFYEVCLQGKIDKKSVSTSKDDFNRKGKVSGIIKQNGSSISKARMFLVNKNSDPKFESKTNSEGEFVFTGVSPAMSLELLALVENPDKHGFLRKGREILLNPGEQIDLGILDIKDGFEDIYPSANEKRQKLSELQRYRGMPKINIVAYLGNPKIKYSNDLWLMEYKGEHFIVVFREENVWNIFSFEPFDEGGSR